MALISEFPALRTRGVGRSGDLPIIELTVSHIQVTGHGDYKSTCQPEQFQKVDQFDFCVVIDLIFIFLTLIE